MASKSYTLNFDGYWREPNIGGLPAQSGVYCVYACTYNAQASTVNLNRVLYIGESADVKTRVAGHEKWAEWRRQLKSGEELCFSAALISPTDDRLRAEAAMVHHHKPPCNTEYVQAFPFDQTTVTTTGKNALLTGVFTVYRK